MKLIIGNKNYSSWSLRPWLFLRESGLEFEEINELLNKADTRERLARYSPSCKVPVLIDGEFTVWDSLAICEYISDSRLDGRGWPADKHTRALARAISAEMHAGFAAMRSELPMNCRAMRKVTSSDAAARDVNRVIQIWNDCISMSGGPWLFGEFSIADCMYAPVALRFRTYGIDPGKPASTFVDAVLGNSHIQDWVRQAAEESEIIPEDETGEPVTV